MPFYERDAAKIYYEELGSGFPLLLISPGGMNSVISFWERMPFNPIESFKGDFHVIAMDQRNAGRSTGPLDTQDPWGSHADDQLGLMSHLGIERFLVLGCCIGGSYIFKLVERAPDRIVAGVLEQPIGMVESNVDLFHNQIWSTWGQDLVANREDITEDSMKEFGRQMWQHDFLLSVDRDFARTVQTPMLVMPGNDAAHPREIGLELAEMLPNAELLDNWKAPAEVVPHTVEAVRAFLKKHAEAASQVPA